jgi:hypothetical protein
MGLIYLLIILEVMSCSMVILLLVNFLNFLLLNAILTCLTNFLIPTSLWILKSSIFLQVHILHLILLYILLVVLFSTSSSVLCLTSNCFMWLRLIRSSVIDTQLYGKLINQSHIFCFYALNLSGKLLMKYGLCLFPLVVISFVSL